MSSPARTLEREGERESSAVEDHTACMGEARAIRHKKSEKRAKQRNTVGMDDLAGDVGRVLVRGEEDERRSDLVRLPGPAHGNTLAEIRHLILREGSRNQRRPDRSRSHRADSYSFVDHLQVKRSGEGHDRSLCRRVVDQRRVPLVRVYRGCVDIVPPSFM